ncbi:hypothetical protein [Chromobacterium sphagni]|uniref:hypothetical protein n=1 Tax=Chromobacterium sphagni TaxID=1903179 RepID=UPI001113E1F4|nr:hypothetical protein [Chromobacterium sphagni]
MQLADNRIGFCLPNGGVNWKRHFANSIKLVLNGDFASGNAGIHVSFWRCRLKNKTAPSKYFGKSLYA